METCRPVVAVDLDDLSGAVELLLVLTRTVLWLDAFPGMQQLTGGTVASREALSGFRVGGKRHDGVESRTRALDLR